ncbi:MAG TPA: 3-phosphoshikimate 1-carboxyvinyltransferase, partial [Roseimicrobium sp.]|nr:3-phosphoshikimate 1-carboxyvinyltransferase [Roseimicrobium sp.]
MPLPELIEIVPLSAPVKAEIVVPGSKSITNRALVLAALSKGRTTLRGALWSEDVQVMVDCLERLGFETTVEPDLTEPGNRTISVVGRDGLIPNAGTANRPLELFVGNAGTAARFLAALVCLGKGKYRLTGVPRMHERPQAALLQSLRQLGYLIDSPNDRLPAVIHGTGPRPGRCSVSVTESSQFASALILSAAKGGWEIDITGANEEELPYVEMTRQLVRAFPTSGGEFQIEPDASGGSYFWAAKAFGHDVSVSHWPVSGWQIDAEFPRFLPLPPTVSRASQLGDSIMTSIVLAPFGKQVTEFTDLGRLRVQECERVLALRTELTKCGANVTEAGDTLTVHPSNLQGSEIETYHDHRMAMCFAVVGLNVPGIRLHNPECVRKTFPNFFQKL